VIRQGERLAARHGAVMGFKGAWIEDKNSGTILLQQAARRGLVAFPIDSALTAMGRDERALDVSGYVHRKWCRFCRAAHAKTVNFKGLTRNHLWYQVIAYRPGDLETLAHDDALDTFTYGLALSCGDSEGF
jgi:hypothetical protein